MNDWFLALCLIMFLHNVTQANILAQCQFITEVNPSANNTLKDIVAEQNVHCLISRDRDRCLSAFDFFLNLDISVNDKIILSQSNGPEIALINLTISTRFNLTQTSVIMLQENQAGTCWCIQLVGDVTQAPRVPHQVVIYGLPVPPDFSQLNATILHRENVRSCGESKACSALNQSMLTFLPKDVEQSITLKLRMRESHEYTVELMYGECRISCESGRSNCTMTSKDVSTLRVDATNWNKYTYIKEYSGLIPAHYCARINPVNDSCCGVSTYTYQLREHKEQRGIIAKAHRSSLDPLFTSKVAAVVMLMFGIALIFVVQRKRISRSPAQVSVTSQECTVSLVTKSEINVLISEMRKTTEVFLVYSNESPEFLNLMCLFRNLLQTVVRKVWDPYSDIEAIMANQSEWVENILLNPKINIVLVESDGAITVDRNENKYDPLCPITGVFFYTLSCLKNNLKLKFNYSRVFIIRMDPNLDRTFLNIVQYARYQMPECFGKLVFDLNRQANIELEDFSRFEISNKEKTMFDQALRDMYKLNR